MKVIAELPRDDGTRCEIFEDSDGRVYFRADADVCADGANGQHGEPAAYRADNSGTDWLENGGMQTSDGRVTFLPGASRNAILGADGNPKIFPGGVVASMTAYRHPNVPGDKPEAYVDAETVPYVVVPDVIVSKTEKVVLGCVAKVTYRDVSVDCVVAETSGERIGEVSIAAARLLGLNSSPRDGGSKQCEFDYELWPGTPAQGFRLQPSPRRR